ncbi:hypothetical protein BXY41_106198 [Lacrimispora xylanisolvens]|uniref:Uncharacterized protein n=1 Tax=Lacrimispora xylanisolvens TaxID=384636 RepID=A0A2S6HSE1_9FIRM|nr:hypothetical protein [Hungatella xylanolytica]PPK80608.1 hypothetical protein BXY41_106198 [Hungatella xylanolytica]
MNQETIKVGDKTYNIANGSCSLHLSNGETATVAIIIGSNMINDIHKNLSENSTITKYTADGVEEWQRGDLVYTGEVKLKSDFPVRIEQKQTGTDDEGKPVYSNVEALEDVVIVEYRTPNIQDKIQSQAEEIKSLRATVDTLILSGLEG